MAKPSFKNWMSTRVTQRERQELTVTIDHWLNHPEITIPNIRDLIKRLDSLGGRL